MWSFIVFLCGVQTVTGFSLSEADFNRLPRLFHYDDYERCLTDPGALYCMGIFRLTPTVTPHYMYDVLKEHSSSKYTFDRTLLHRGYCVTSRCPNIGQNNTSPADRFEKCVQKWARPLKLHSRLETLNYCRGAEDHLQGFKEVQEDHSLHQLFLKITFSLLLMNVVGTVYDMMLGKDKKNRLLLAWSVTDNWRRLITTNLKDDLSTLAPMQGYRIFGVETFIYSHVLSFHHMVYVKNPQFLEHMSANSVNMVLKNSTPGVMVFILLSNFLLAHSMLTYREKSLYFTKLPMIIVRRIARITPVYLYVLLFAITWWPMLHDGPMWQLLTSEESDICKRKFWSQMFFINNYVEQDKHCFIQTWYLAADMQLYIFAAIVTITIARLKLKPLPILSTMLVTSCAVNIVLAYVYKWKSFMFISAPDDMRTLFREQHSFWGMYTSAWSSLPSCILGLYVAHKHYYEKVEGKKIHHSKIFYFCSSMVIPLIFLLWKIFTFTPENNELLTSVVVGLERPLFTLLGAMKLYSLCKGIQGRLSRLLSWHGFCVMGRLSLSVLVLHWSIVSYIVAGRSTVFYTDAFVMLSDTLTASVLSFIIAVPFTLMLEMPVYRSVCSVFQ